MKKFKIYKLPVVRNWRHDLRWVIRFPNGNEIINITFVDAVKQFALMAGIGRRGRLKICCQKWRGGSNPSWRTKFMWLIKLLCKIGIHCRVTEYYRNPDTLFRYIRHCEDCGAKDYDNFISDLN